MKKPDYLPAYVRQMKRHWQNVMPVRSELTPKICSVVSPSCTNSRLHADDGQHAVDTNQRDCLLLVRSSSAYLMIGSDGQATKGK